MGREELIKLINLIVSEYNVYDTIAECKHGFSPARSCPNECKEKELDLLLGKYRSIAIETQDWIDVKDRLPEEQAEHVLISDGEDCFIGYYREDTKSWDNCNSGWVTKYYHDGKPVYPKITKWMPLPKP